jgi:hypothetical protein
LKKSKKSPSNIEEAELPEDNLEYDMCSDKNHSSNETDIFENENVDADDMSRDGSKEESKDGSRDGSKEESKDGSRDGSDGFFDMEDDITKSDDVKLLNTISNNDMVKFNDNKKLKESKKKKRKKIFFNKKNNINHSKGLYLRKNFPSKRKSFEFKRPVLKTNFNKRLFLFFSKLLFFL